MASPISLPRSDAVGKICSKIACIHDAGGDSPLNRNESIPHALSRRTVRHCHMHKEESSQDCPVGILSQRAENKALVLKEKVAIRDIACTHSFFYERLLMGPQSICVEPFWCAFFMHHFINQLCTVLFPDCPRETNLHAVLIF